MAKRSIEDRLTELRAAVDPDPGSAQARVALLEALASKQGLLAAAAAQLVAREELAGFELALGQAFERFLDDPVKRDPFCRAKTAAAQALYRTGAAAASVFLRGIRHVQLEPVWGGSQDTAVELRGICALGLVRGGYPDALLELADLLADAEPMARVAAAQAIAYSERDDGLPLLRLKARSGDADPRVTSACFAGLLALAPQRSLEFVATFARHPSVELREAALISLGESRLPAALPLLTELAEHAVAEDEAKVALLAIALMRSDAAWDYLIDLLRDGPTSRALAALDALATYRDDSALRARMLAAIEARGDAQLSTRAAAALTR